MKTHSEKISKQRRFYMILPVLVLPFVIMLFWALGGGQVTPAHADALQSGLDLSLPDAYFPKGNETWNKLTYYEQAEKDSVKNRKAQESDPYFSLNELSATSNEHDEQDPIKENKTTIPPSPLNASVDERKETNDIEDKVNDKLQQLYQQLNTPAQEAVSMKPDADVPAIRDEPFSQDVDRLEKMMEMMSQGDASDPEMQQIQNVLDKILDIQHPERVANKIRQQSLEHRKQVFPVSIANNADNIFLFGSKGGSPAANDTIREAVASWIEQPNAFYGLADERPESRSSTAIEAVIHNTQTVVAGSTIKMRLLSDLYINGQLIEKGQFVYGICAINGERLTVTVNVIRYDQSLYPVSLTAFDLDGIEGIHIPGAITRDVAKQASGQSIQDMQLYSMDNSLGVQAATAGIEAAKGLIGKRAKLIKITLKAGYHILLQDNNQPK